MFINRLKIYFNMSCIRVLMYYHQLNNLDKLLNGGLIKKIRLVIHSRYLMERECNCFSPSKVNDNCVYEGKFRGEYLIYEVKCTLCDNIFIRKTQQTFKKIMDSHFSDVQRILINGQKPDLLAARYKQHFKSNMTCTDLHRCMTSKVFKHIKTIGAIKSSKKSN